MGGNLRNWVVFFSKKFFFGKFFENFWSFLLIGWNQNCNLSHFEKGIECAIKFPIKVYNLEFWNYARKHVFWALKIEKKPKKTFILKKNPFFWGIAENLRRCSLFFCSWVILTEQKRKKGMGKNFFCLKIEYFYIWTLLAFWENAFIWLKTCNEINLIWRQIF